MSVGHMIAAQIHGQLKSWEACQSDLKAARQRIKPGTTGEPMVLPEGPTERKGMPICTGVLDYFPRALAAVSKCSKAGNDQHNPGQPLHWDKSKSGDHADCIVRHLIDRNAVDTDGIPHAVKLAWRALANLEIMIENGEVKL